MPQRSGAQRLMERLSRRPFPLMTPSVATPPFIGEEGLPSMADLIREQQAGPLESPPWRADRTIAPPGPAPRPSSEMVSSSPYSVAGSEIQPLHRNPETEAEFVGPQIPSP